MLFKSLEFKRKDGQKVKVMEIPVLEENNSYRFIVDVRLQTYLTALYNESGAKNVHSFREHLKKAVKWRDYEAIFQSDILKHNA